MIHNINEYLIRFYRELAQHLVLHGMHDLKLDASGQLSSSVEKVRYLTLYIY